MCRIIYLIFVVLISNSLLAQNLVKNSQFEKVVYGENQAKEPMAQNWSYPYRFQGKFMQVDSGNSVARIILTAPPKDDAIFHFYHQVDYLQGSLTRVLDPSKTYYFKATLKCDFKSKQNGTEFWAHGVAGTSDTSHILRQVASNNFGLLILKDSISSDDIHDMPYLMGIKPDYNYCNIISNNGQWETVSGTFRPKESGAFFLLGNFYSPDKARMSITEGERKSHYIVTKDLLLKDERIASYYIDNVIIREVNRNDPIGGNCAVELKDSLILLFRNNEPSESRVESSKLRHFMNRFKDSLNLQIVVLGYTDTVGTFLDNKKLSLERAVHVKNELLKLGRRAEEIKYYGVGEVRSDTDLMLNRKVVVKIEPRKRQRVFTETYTARPETEDEKILCGEYFQSEMHVLNSLDDFDYQRLRMNIERGCRVQDAYNAILDASVGKEIVFFGEAHLLPSHRAFVLKLLEGLRKQGFQNLFLEAIKSDFALGRKFPILSDGYYCAEPIYGELVRHALSLGFNIYSYEPIQEELDVSRLELEKRNFFRYKEEGSFMNTDGTWVSLNDGLANMTIRNHAQAANILAKIDGRSIVLGGENHNHFLKCGNEATAGYWLKELSKWKVLSVSQSSLFSDSISISDVPFVLSKESEFIGASSFCPILEDEIKTSDISVFHPVTDINIPIVNTPFVLEIPKVTMNYPVLLSIFVIDEPIKTAIPVLNRIYSSKEALFADTLLLPAGRQYKAILRDPKRLIALKVKNDGINRK